MAGRRCATLPDMPELVPSFLRHLAAQNRSGRTKKTYAAIVTAFFAFIGRPAEGSAAPSRAEVESFLARPLLEGGDRSAATRNQELAALRAFSTFARRELGWVADPTDGIAFLKEQPRDPPVLSVFEIRRLFSLASSSARGWQRERDLAMLALLSQLGLRVHELVALNVAQLDPATATLVDVEGKGGSRHDLPLNPQTLTLLETWLAVRGGRVSPDEPALFVSARGVRVSIRSVERFIERLRRLSGTNKRVTPHTLRHSAATVALTLGTDVATVAELLRHADLNTTRKYLHLVDERKREAVRKLAVAIPPELVASAGSRIPLASLAPGPAPIAANETSAREVALPAEEPLDASIVSAEHSAEKSRKSRLMTLDHQGDLDDRHAERAA